MHIFWTTISLHCTDSLYFILWTIAHSCTNCTALILKTYIAHILFIVNVCQYKFFTFLFSLFTVVHQHIINCWRESGRFFDGLSLCPGQSCKTKTLTTSIRFPYLIILYNNAISLCKYFYNYWSRQSHNHAHTHAATGWMCGGVKVGKLSLYVLHEATKRPPFLWFIAPRPSLQKAGFFDSPLSVTEQLWTLLFLDVVGQHVLQREFFSTCIHYIQSYRHQKLVGGNRSNLNWPVTVPTWRLGSRCIP